MREFAGRSHLRRLPLESRILYSAFLLFLLFGVLVMVLLAVNRAGLTPQPIAEYYVGDEDEGIYGKTYGEMLETTHFHLFSVPVLLLILTHLFQMTRLPGALKLTLVLTGFATGALYVAGPWLIMYVSPGFAPLLAITRALLLLSLLAYILVPLWDMWTPTE